VKAGIFCFGQHSTPWHAKREKSALGQGAHMIRSICLDAGFDVVDLCARWEKVDVIMVTMYWWEHLYDLIAWLAVRGIEFERAKRKGKPLLFVGGQLPSYNPGPMRDIVDLVCVGDGEEVAPAVLAALTAGTPLPELVSIPGVYVSSEDNRAVWQHVDDISATLKYPFINHALLTGESGVKSNKTWERRIEVARGCRRKCAFCGVSWTKRYREQDPDAVVEQLMSTDTCVKCFAPDLRAHSRWDVIERAYVESNRVNQACDISTAVILRHGFGNSRFYSTGIDGLSERIRFALSKPLTRAELREVVEKSNGHMGSLGMYMILGLPGEELSDVREWFETLAGVELKATRTLTKRDVSRGFSAERFYAIVTLNAFCPTPHTPLQWAGIDWREDLTEKYMGEIGILGDKDERPLKHKLLGRAHKGLARILETAALRCGPEIAPFLYAAAANRRGWTPSAALRVARKLGLMDHLQWALAEKRVGEPLPWTERVEPLFPQRAFAASWSKYRRIMGMEPPSPLRAEVLDGPG